MKQQKYLTQFHIEVLMTLSLQHDNPIVLPGLVDVAEVGVFSICQILESVSVSDIFAKLTILLLVAEREIKSQKGNDEDKSRIAAEMDSQGLEVARVVVEEDLGASSVASAPGEEVHGNAYRLLGLTSNISREHGHAETLGCPESKDDPVTDQQTGPSCTVFVLDSHNDNGTDESRDQVNGHGQQVLLGLLDDPD